jgi:hypothetical protein
VKLAKSIGIVIGAIIVFVFSSILAVILFSVVGILLPIAFIILIAGYFWVLLNTPKQPKK